MFLDLREIIGVPGESVSFEFEPDLSDAIDGSIVAIKNHPRAAGNVTNRAGVLTFSAIVDAVCVCVCARCLVEFEHPIHQQISQFLTEGGDDGDDPDSYLLQGDGINAGEIVTTEFLLSLDNLCFCRDDCAGLCDICGIDLNSESCNCSSDCDPRLAALAQLLDDDD